MGSSNEWQFLAFIPGIFNKSPGDLGYTSLPRGESRNRRSQPWRWWRLAAACSASAPQTALAAVGVAGEGAGDRAGEVQREEGELGADVAEIS